MASAGSMAAGAGFLACDLVGIPGTLSLVGHEEVLGRCPPACSLEGVLENSPPHIS